MKRCAFLLYFQNYCASRYLRTGCDVKHILLRKFHPDRIFPIRMRSTVYLIFTSYRGKNSLFNGILRTLISVKYLLIIVLLFVFPFSVYLLYSILIYSTLLNSTLLL